MVKNLRLEFTQLALYGLCVSSVIAFTACSGTSSATPERTAEQPTQEPTTPTAPTTQDPQKPSAAALVEQALSNARRSLDNRLFEDARREAAVALEFDNDNEAAREILRRCNEVLGDAPVSPSGRLGDLVLTNRIQAERERGLVRHELEIGDAHRSQNQFGRALEHYERAQQMMKFSPHAQANDPLRREVDVRVDETRKQKRDAESAATNALRTASEQELQRIQDENAMSRELRTERLLADANVMFQQGSYRQAVERVDQVLLLDPTNPTARALRDLADRARSSAATELHRERWKQEWNMTFLDLQQSAVPQTEVVKYDPARWAEVSQRKPASFTTKSALDLPENKAIQSALDSTRIEHQFASATVQSWADYYAAVTGVTFFVTPEVAAMDAEKTTLVDFKMPVMSVTQALRNIATQTGVAYKIKDGMVHLVSPENAIGTLFTFRHRVADLVSGVKDRPGPTLSLRVPGDDSPLFPEEEEEAPPSVVDDTRLREMIQNTVAVGKWENAPFSLSYSQGNLQVRADQETQDAVSRLLNDLRRHVGIQVDVESRFLKVEDSFLEDVGVDFRGLGDQSAQGIPGRGLEGRNGAGFDDFGVNQQINPASPGQIGTGTEPGFFYDDGQDGDYMGRIEHLYDQTLGGHSDLDNSGGLALQYAYLNDIQVEIVLRAVQKQERSEEIDAPRLLIYNNTRGSMSFLRQISYIRDFQVEIAQAAAVANPVIDVVHDGVALDVRPVVDADLRFITMELRPTVMSLQLPIPTFTTTLGVGQPISIQLPSVTVQRVRTTVTMPDGGTMMLGGMKLAERQSLQSGVPLLKDLPGLSFFFSRKGTSVLNRKILILIRAKIVLMEEHAPEQIALPDGNIVSAR